MTMASPTSAGASDRGQDTAASIAARIDIRNLGFELRVKSRRLTLLRDISCTVRPGELLALMGPAGAGKTTLMETINGTLCPTSGQVLVNGLDVHRHFDALRGHFGYVPQDDIVHRRLTVYEACFFTAKMRREVGRGKKISDKALHDRVVSVLSELDISSRANTIIGGPEGRVLSGGQRKRVNLAMELVTDPAVLFLDEPTSGLSSTDAMGVMELLERLRDQGRTIIVTIHQPSRELYEMMDMVLILGVGGRMVYYGPVRAVYRHFKTAPTPEALFETFSPRQMDDAAWRQMAEDYRRTKDHEECVVDRLASPLEPEERTPSPRVDRAVGLGQLLVLFERMSKLYTRDVGWLAGALLGAPLLTLLLTTQVGDIETRHTLLFVVTLIAYFFGIFPALEMIYGERTIYARERMVNLKIPSYVFSKVGFLFVFGMIQAFSIAAILVWYGGVDASIASVFVVVLSVQFAGVAMGLLFSTLAQSTRVALLMMLACVIVMIIFSGFVVTLPRLRDDGTSWLLAPSALRWGLGGLMSIVHDVPSTRLKFFGFHNESWGLDIAVNLALATLPLGITMFILKARDRV